MTCSNEGKLEIATQIENSSNQAAGYGQFSGIMHDCCGSGASNENRKVGILATAVYG